MKKGLIIYILLILLILAALIGLIVSCVLLATNTLAAVGIALCAFALLILLILLCCFYWKLYKVWRSFHRPSEFKINSEVAEIVPGVHPAELQRMPTGPRIQKFSYPNTVAAAPQIINLSSSSQPQQIISSSSTSSQPQIISTSSNATAGNTRQAPIIIKYI